MTPENIAKTAALTAAGMPHRQVAAQIGASPSAVMRARKSAKDIIEAIRDDLINHTAATAADNIKHAITAYRQPARRKDGRPNPDYPDTQLREHGFKASTRLMETIGIYPSHTPSVLIQQIISDNHSISSTPESMTLLARALGLRQPEQDNQVIDCDSVDNPVDNSKTLTTKAKDYGS